MFKFGDISPRLRIQRHSRLGAIRKFVVGGLERIQDGVDYPSGRRATPSSNALTVDRATPIWSAKTFREQPRIPRAALICSPAVVSRFLQPLRRQDCKAQMHPTALAGTSSADESPLTP
jgi:hypothetical protein